jgi:hypothetical protein
VQGEQEQREEEAVQEEAQEEQEGLQQGQQEDLEENHKKNKKSLSQHKELQDMSHEELSLLLTECHFVELLNVLSFD